METKIATTTANTLAIQAANSKRITGLLAYKPELKTAGEVLQNLRFTNFYLQIRPLVKSTNFEFILSGKYKNLNQLKTLYGYESTFKLVAFFLLDYTKSENLKPEATLNGEQTLIAIDTIIDNCPQFSIYDIILAFKNAKKNKVIYARIGVSDIMNIMETYRQEKAQKVRNYNNNIAQAKLNAERKKWKEQAVPAPKSFNLAIKNLAKDKTISNKNTNKLNTKFGKMRQALDKAGVSYSLTKQGVQTAYDALVDGG